MLSYDLGTVNNFHCGFKPVLSYIKPVENCMHTAMLEPASRQRIRSHYE